MTAKKKTLIELMLDAGVKPESLSDETKFIVCDSNGDGKHFISEYSALPKFKEDTQEWYSNGFVSFNLDVKYACEKWESAIITKQQFIDAYNEKNKFEAPHKTPESDTQLINEEYSFSDVVKSKSDGSTASYYELPAGAKELQDLISHRDMNSQIGEVFRACYRYGLVEHSDKLRDAKKIKFYAEAEIKRLEKLQGSK